VGIELLTIDARIVVASVDTYLRFAEAVGRLNLDADRRPGLTELVEDVTGGVASSGTRGQLDEGFSSNGDEHAGEPEPARPRRRRRAARSGEE
jgi:gas vesicle structural protein